MAKERTEVQDIDRSLYDFRYEEKDSDFYKIKEGLTPEIVEEISDKKNDPQWMRDFRLKALEVYHKTDIPNWGPDISDLNMDNIVTYVKPKTKMSADWEEVPEDIKNTFEKLGIPEAERKSLAGVGAQYDSELVYHNLQEEVAAKGVVYSDIESALHGPYGEMIEKHFMKLVPPTDHKFAALHGAVWSGGSFVYVPKGVNVEIPLQSYFRLNAPGAGQFEHTLIIVKHQKSQSGRKRYYGVGFRFLRFPYFLSVSYDHFKGRQCQGRIYRSNLCRSRTESGYRCQDGAYRKRYQLLYQYPFYFQERRYFHLSFCGGNSKSGEKCKVCGILSIFDAG